MFQYQESLLIANDYQPHMKMMFHIDDFKCTLCSNWFCPPFNMPYLLPCTHSICTSCLQKASTNNDHIICPEDLETCSIQSININLTTKKALERLMKEHKNYNQNTQLECIKSLSIGFDQILFSKEKQLRNLEALIDQIFESQIVRLKGIHQKIKTDINRPYRIVEDWKEIVSSHLTTIRKGHSNHNYSSNSTSNESRSGNMMQLNHYIEEGRKIKMDLNQFFQLEFDLFADRVMRNPRVCFEKDFTVNAETLQNKLRIKNIQVESTVNKKQRTKDRSEEVLITQTYAKFEPNDLSKSGTMLISDHKSSNVKQHQKALANVDLNRMPCLEPIQCEIQGIETKRGVNKQKNSQVKMTTNLGNENVLLGKYTTNNENQKNVTKVLNARKQSENKVKKNQSAPSPKAQSKNIYQKNKQNRQMLKNDLKPNSRCSLNEVSMQNRNAEFSLSQFQLETLQDAEKDEMFNDRVKSSQLPSPKNQSSRLISRQSQNQSYSNSEHERMHKLARMLDVISANTSNNHSTRNSLKKSRKNRPSYDQRKGLGNIHLTSVENNSLLMSPNTIHEQYTEEADSQKPYEQQQLLNNEQMLLNQDDNGWQMGNINFLKEWRLRNENNVEQPLEIRQNTYYYNCQKQKLSYMRKMQVHRVQEALKLTIVKDNYIELINQSLHDVDMTLYLEQFDWKHGNIEIVKLVKVSLTDEQLNVLLNFMVKSTVKALVLSGNNLTDVSLDALLNFVTLNNALKNVYLPKNYVNILKSKPKINLLKDKGVNIYI